MTDEERERVEAEKARQQAQAEVQAMIAMFNARWLPYCFFFVTIKSVLQTEPLYEKDFEMDCHCHWCDFVIGMIGVALETPEQKAEREAKMVAEKAEKERLKAEAEAKEQAEKERLKAEQAEKDRLEAEAKAKEEAEKEKQKHLQSLQSELLAYCQLEIQKYLHNKKSMETDHYTVRIWESDVGTYRVGFEFNASNLYGAEVTHKAVCEFDKNKKLINKEVAWIQQKIPTWHGGDFVL